MHKDFPYTMEVIPKARNRSRSRSPADKKVPPGFIPDVELLKEVLSLRSSIRARVDEIVQNSADRKKQAIMREKMVEEQIEKMRMLKKQHKSPEFSGFFGPEAEFKPISIPSNKDFGGEAASSYQFSMIREHQPLSERGSKETLVKEIKSGIAAIQIVPTYKTRSSDIQSPVSIMKNNPVTAQSEHRNNSSDTNNLACTSLATNKKVQIIEGIEEEGALISGNLELESIYPNMPS